MLLTSRVCPACIAKNTTVARSDCSLSDTRQCFSLVSVVRWSSPSKRSFLRVRLLAAFLLQQVLRRARMTLALQHVCKIRNCQYNMDAGCCSSQGLCQHLLLKNSHHSFAAIALAASETSVASCRIRCRDFNHNLVVNI